MERTESKCGRWKRRKRVNAQLLHHPPCSCLPPCFNHLSGFTSGNDLCPPQSWLSSVPAGAWEGGPSVSGRDGPSHPRCHKRGGDVHIAPQPLASVINAACPAPRAPSTEGDLGLPLGQGVPRGEGLPDVHWEHTSCGKDMSALLERAKQQLPRYRGDREEKKHVQTQRGGHRAKPLSRVEGAGHIH